MTKTQQSERTVVEAFSRLSDPDQFVLRCEYAEDWMDSDDWMSLRDVLMRGKDVEIAEAGLKQEERWFAFLDATASTELWRDRFHAAMSGSQGEI